MEQLWNWILYFNQISGVGIKRIRIGTYIDTRNIYIEFWIPFSNFVIFGFLVIDLEVILDLMV